ncbi:Ig-like domain repeat protein [Terracidiphilus gabretensis]|uniref:Ig-like domain repeat protein n=1 Tax=Terracidiphilus gabretensis TaxID=1577687 RepID=UPI00071B60AE|nr:Ig-like domain repeat protein [Terracidiphilus gabretensis]
MKHTFSSRSRIAALALCAAVSAVPCVLPRANAQSSVTPEARISQAISDHSLVRLTGNTPPFTHKANDLGVAADDLSLRHLQLVLKHSDTQEAALEKLLHDQQKSGSASYHKWLTPQVFGATYGVSDSDISKVTAWLDQHGFTVEGVSNGRNVITFSGTQAQLRSAFHTEMHQYSINGQTHYANATDPMIPAAIAPVVTGFASLTTYGKTPLHTTPQMARRAAGGKWQQYAQQPTMRSQTAIKSASPQFTAAINGSNYYFLAPGDFGTIYNVKPVWNQKIDGSGQTIAIVAQSDVNPADVDAFRTAFNLPEKKLNTIYVGENPGYTGDSTEGEADLDVEWSGAVAPNATIDLIVSGQTNTGGGVTEAAQYAVDNNVAPILSVSWGGCELALGASGNQFFNDMWQQAAAEGITVLVAAGDSGSASCDQNQELSFYGEQVSGFASTPYNTAVGGTDFSGNYGHTSQYWGSTNAADGSSALSYIPESPWNETCASTLVLVAAQQNGFSADTTNEALCNDFSNGAPFLNTAGGGGGASRCTQSDASDPSSCTGGYPRPDWQLSVPGMPQNGVRNLPDVSFFAGSGLWGSAYLFCQSDSTPDSTCNYQNGDLAYLTAGGTSFATPAFAGVVALMNQKAQGSLGNINYSLYQMGAAQYGSNGPAVYHDITTDNNATPCLAGNVAVPPGTLCSVTNPDDEVGMLPDYNANVGYDLASGLGSADVSALLNAWSNAIGGLSNSTTTLNLSGTALVYGASLKAQVQVAAASGAKVPTGAVALFDQDTATGTPLGNAQLANGAAAVMENMLSAGTHILYARYTGDGSFGVSTSSTSSVTVSQAATAMTLGSSQSTVAPGGSVLVKVNIGTATSAASPTGSVVLTDTTTGKTLTTVPLLASTDTSGNSIANAAVSVPGQWLANGANVISATYAGDTNYTGSTNSLTVSYTAPFALTLPQATLTLSPGSTTGNTMAITVTPAAGTTLNPSSLIFGCPGTLPTGMTCSFSTPVAASSGAVSSTLTITLSGPLAAQSQPRTIALLGTGAMTGLACIVLLGLPGRKRRFHFVVLLATISVFAFVTGCTNGSKPNVANTGTSATALSVSSASPALGSAVTLTASVGSATGSGGSPSGTVTFEDGTNVLGTGSVSGGSATLTTSSLAIGNHSIVASYGGDSTFTGSNSAATAVDVTLTAPVTVQVMDNAGNIAAQSLTVTVQ